MKKQNPFDDPLIDNELNGVLSSAWKSIKNAGKKVDKAINKIIPDAVSNLVPDSLKGGNGIKALAAVGSLFIPGVGPAISGVITAAGGAISAGAGAVSSLVGGTLSGLGISVPTIGGITKTIATGAATKLLTGAGIPPEQALAAVQGITSVKDLSNIPTEIKSKVLNAFNHIADGSIQQQVNEAVAKLSQQGYTDKAIAEYLLQSDLFKGINAQLNEKVVTPYVEQKLQNVVNAPTASNAANQYVQTVSAVTATDIQQQAIKQANNGDIASVLKVALPAVLAVKFLG